MLNESEKQELEQLRKSAHVFITCPMEKAFFHLESLMDRPYSKKFDAVMAADSFFILARALIELKKKIIK